MAQVTLNITDSATPAEHGMKEIGEDFIVARAATFPLTVTVGKGDKATVVEVQSLSVASIIHAMKRGLQEDLNNAKAGLGDDPAEALRRIEAVANKYATADFTRATGNGPSGVSDDPEVVAAQIAREEVADRIKTLKGKKPDGSDFTAEDKKTAQANWLRVHHDRLVKEAKKRIDARKAAASSVIEAEGDDILKSLFG